VTVFQPNHDHRASRTGQHWTTDMRAHDERKESQCRASPPTSGPPATHAPTRDYVARRTTEGRTSREIKRCLSRYIARDLYRLLESGTPRP
jgi:hypothetical protein